MSVFRLSKAQQKRLTTLGATVTSSHATVTEAELKTCHIGGARRRLLIARGQLTVSG